MTDVDISFDKILDRIIEITEKNLTMQSEFLKAVYDLKGRFDTIDRDHKESLEDVKTILTNTFDIFNKMKMASNEKILGLIEDLIKEIRILEKIKENIESLKESKEEREALKISIKEIAKDIKSVSNSYALIKKILSGISIAVVGFGIIWSLWQTFKMDSIERNLLQKMETILRRK